MSVRGPLLILTIIVMLAVLAHPAIAAGELNPDFTGAPASGPAPLTVRFTDTSTGEHDHWEWDFGDGNFSTIQKPVYTYYNAGSYTVKLIISNASGEQATISQNNYITVEPPPIPEPLVPDFTGTPRSGVAPLTVRFNDTSTGPHDHWEWDFGDGNTSSIQKPLYLYNQPGLYTVKLTISDASSEQATISQNNYITVEPPLIPEPLVPDFHGTPRSGVAPLSVQFNDTSTGPRDQWKWDFGDGNTSNQQNPLYIYNEAGSYNVKLDISNASGEQATITHYDYITVDPAPLTTELIPNFTGTPRSGVSPLVVQFTDTSTVFVEPVTYLWDFGDGNTSSIQNPRYIFEQPGSFSVTLTIGQTSGTLTTITKKDFITVNPVPLDNELTPNFKAMPRSGVNPLTVQFNDTSTGFTEPVTYLWDFGDGNTSSTQNPLYIYYEPGSYSVKLDVTNASGEPATITQKNFITVNSAPSTSELIPNFTGTPRSGFRPLIVKFTDTSTGFTEPVTYLWDFGDGNTSSIQNPQYTFEQPGAYSVTLTIGQASGTLAMITKNNYITITTVPLVLPVADFFATPTSGTAPLTVIFSDLSTNTTLWNWSFGDDSLENATDQNPIHTYTNPGTYTVSLKATNADGSDTQTRADYVKVNPAAASLVLPVADFFATPTSGTALLTVTFSDLSTNTTLWNWSFGDDSLENATEQNPVHTYTNSGTYTISLKATNADGSDTQTRADYVKVNPAAASLVLPVADFFATPTSGTAPLTVTFSDLSTNTTLWNWSFGDDSLENTTQQNPIHTYTNPGTYTVSLKATNTDLSNTATKNEYIIVSEPPLAPIPLVADFSGIPTSGSAPLTVTFSDLSTNNPSSWNWSFGDDSLENATDQNPIHTYTNAGMYTVSLNATNADDSNTSTKSEYISVSVTPLPQLPPVADFTGIPNSGVAPLTVTFEDLSSNNPTTWNWSFGDGNSSIHQNLSYTYASAGIYSVTLNVTNAEGSNTTTKTNYINVTAASSEPAADFNGTPTSGLTPLSVQFTDLSTGFNEPIAYFWDFGDGFNSTEQNPVHTYSASIPENYTVTLNVTGNYGKTAEMVKSEYISIEIPTIELILSEETLDQTLPSNEQTSPTQSLPQSKSSPMAKSVLLQAQSLSQDIPKEQDLSLPQDVSQPDELSAVLQNPDVQWSLNRGENSDPHSFSMIVHSTIPWKVVVYDAANYGKPGTPGKMSEYDFQNKRYLSGGYTLQNALHLQTEQFKYPENLGLDVLLSATPSPLQTGPRMVSHDDPFKYYINLKQRVEGVDHSSSQNTKYRIVITFEALPNF